MKKVYFKKITGITVLLWFACGALYAQDRNLKRELLVYIMPDSLELPVHEKGKLSLQYADIKSATLATVLARINATGIERAFPTWSDKDSVVTRLDGERVPAPPFHRIFKLIFNSAADADSAITILKETSAVVFAEKHTELTLYNDQHYINGTQWYLNNDGRNGGVAGADINVEGAWAIYTGNPNNIIAIIDDGVELTHEDLTGKATGDTHLGYSHGTQVAGVAAARALNTHGIRGVDWNAQILSKRIQDEYDYFYGDEVIAQKITDAINEGAAVLNCSWGGQTYSTTLALAFAFAYKMNRVSVAAMGNTSSEQVNYPAALPNVIAVGATQNNDINSPFSTRGNHIDVVAPGGINPYPNYDGRDIFSTTVGNNYAYTSGTSFSAPQVTGLTSLLKGYKPNLSNDDIRQIVRLSADDDIVPGHDPAYGYGRINAGRALQILQAPNELKQWTASGGTSVSFSNSYTMVFMGVPGLASSTYIVKRHEVRKDISFPQSFCQIIGAWGRGVYSSGWHQGNPNYGEGFCEVVPGTLTTTGATLRTYVYQVYSINGSYLGYYPSSPANVTFAYSALGIPNPTGTVTGPSFVCSSSASFTVNNLPSGATIVWNQGPYLTRTSEQGSNPCTFTSTGSGSSWVRATLITDCGNVPLTDKAVWAGTPVISSVSGPAYTPNNQWAAYYAQPNNPAMGASDYSWTLNPLNGNSVYDNGWNADIAFYNSGNYQLVVRGQNTCGWGNYTVTGIEVYDSEGLSIFPNPASGEVTLTIETSDEKELPVSGWDLEIYAPNMMLKEKKTSLKDNKTIINTSGWQEGIYMVRVKYGESLITGKLVVKR